MGYVVLSAILVVAVPLAIWVLSRTETADARTESKARAMDYERYRQYAALMTSQHLILQKILDLDTGLPMLTPSDRDTVARLVHRYEALTTDKEITEG